MIEHKMKHGWWLTAFAIAVSLCLMSFATAARAANHEDTFCWGSVVTAWDPCNSNEFELESAHRYTYSVHARGVEHSICIEDVMSGARACSGGPNQEAWLTFTPSENYVWPVIYLNTSGETKPGASTKVYGYHYYKDPPPSAPPAPPVSPPPPPTPNIYEVQMNGTATGKTEVHVLQGAGGYQNWSIEQPTPLAETSKSQWRWLAADMNSDGNTDLVGIRMSGTAGKKTAIHVLDGATQFQSWLIQRETILGETSPSEWQWAVGDTNNDHYPDLVGVRMNNTSGGHTNVHVLDGASQFQKWLVQRETPLGQTNSSQWKWTMGDTNADGAPDLIGVRMNGTSGKKTNVHVLSGKTEYQTYLAQRETPLAETYPSQWQWSAADENRDGYADLIGMTLNKTGSKKTEVHVLSGSSQYQSWLTQVSTPLGEVSAEQWELIAGP